MPSPLSEIVRRYTSIDSTACHSIPYSTRVAPASRSRNTGKYDIAGIWSVMLRPNGFHIDHVHPQGWLSSACYIDLPAAVDKDGHEVPRGSGGYLVIQKPWPSMLRTVYPDPQRYVVEYW